MDGAPAKQGSFSAEQITVEVPAKIHTEKKPAKEGEKRAPAEGRAENISRKRLTGNASAV